LPDRSSLALVIETSYIHLGTATSHAW